MSTSFVFALFNYLLRPLALLLSPSCFRAISGLVAGVPKAMLLAAGSPGIIASHQSYRLSNTRRWDLKLWTAYSASPWTFFRPRGVGTRVASSWPQSKSMRSHPSVTETGRSADSLKISRPACFGKITRSRIRGLDI